ncbi:MAG: hypothetical protein R2737_00125 [Candidatus Nanopelagicales bacterium]
MSTGAGGGRGRRTVRLDAFSGADGPVVGEVRADPAAWAVRPPDGFKRRDLLPSPARPDDWADPRIGWGLVLPDDPAVPVEARSRADDAPEPIRALAQARGGRVLRYGLGAAAGSWTLRDYAGGTDLPVAASAPGGVPSQLPMYLLLYGTPAQIPWQLQYHLGPVRHVGRLDLTGDALDRYVTCLLDDWSDAAPRYDAPVVWAVDHGGGDITTLMRTTVAEPVAHLLSADSDMPGATYVDGSLVPATTQALVDAVVANTPALVVTSSHGMTGPLSDPVRMAADLGLPVGAEHQPLRPEDLLARWQPDGAVWFAQACCSAGAESPSAYRGLFEPGSLVDGVLEGVAGVGPCVAPLPRALLGASRPLRAFIGHVEPTFDWTLASPENGEPLAADLQAVLYERLCLGQPVGLAMERWYQAIGSLLLGYTRAVSTFNASTGEEAARELDRALSARVAAYDRAGTVLLGDPTVRIPVPGPVP